MSTRHTERTGGRIPVRRDRARLAQARARARFEWLLLARGRPSKLYGYASRHRGELIHLPWPPYWCLELHHDPYRDARSTTVWGHRWGWPPTHVRPRCVQDCALDSCLYVCCGYGEKLQPVGFVKSYVTNSQLDTLRVLLVGKDGAVYVHHMRAARLCRLASSTTEFTRRGLQRDAVTYEEDLELPDQRMCGTNARHLFDVIAAAADEHNLLTVGGLCQTHAGVCCNLLETVGDPWTAVPGARMTLTVPQVQYRLWPEARRDLRRHLYAGHPLGPWLVCGVLSRERETQRPSPPICSGGATVGNVATPGPREVEIVWVVLTLAGPLLAFWPDTGKICRLANSFSTLWRMGPRAMRGHWTYSAPGRHLPGDAWPLCEHVRPQVGKLPRKRAYLD
ncbi:DR6 [Human betaherpesvirus 6A]|uniref:DR6 protein n=1 Tax=Human betaherpesvirus 6A TaxID=32603 RepID=A0A0A7RM43_9BETA|nr:DR6 [Human betaherpesvirus 6A]AJA36303.1 DR6 [Human betaherpesvirus 6A]